MGGDFIQTSRFFTNKQNIDDKGIIITGDDVNHIKNVLRLSVGNQIVVCDGDCCDYLVEIDKIEKESIRTKIIESENNINEPDTKVFLFQGISKSDKMNFTIQKSIELGVTKIIPTKTERTVVRFKNSKDEIKKTERWNRIALEAAKQCGRGVVPKVNQPVNFEKVVKNSLKSDLCIMPYVNQHSKGLKNILKEFDKGSISVIIGPEGGFTKEEAHYAEQKGVLPVSLGPRILRTETAGIAVISILMYETDNMAYK